MTCKSTVPGTQRAMTRGDTFRFRVQVLRDPATKVLGIGPPVNLAGVLAAWATFKNNVALYDQGQLQKTLGSGVTVVDAALGIVEVTLDPLDTRGFADGPTKLVYDVQLKEADGSITTIDSGVLVVSPDVTRAIS